MQVPVVVGSMAVSSERKLAAATKGVEHGALGSHGELGRAVIERVDGVVQGVIGGVVWCAGFKSERTLARSGRELVDGEALMDVLGAAEAVETGAREYESIALTLLPFAEAGVDVAAHGNELEIRAQGEDHGLAARAGGGDTRAGGQHVQAPVIFADEGIACIGTGRNGGESEARIEQRGEIFERVHGEVDAAGGESVLNLLDEDAGAVGRETVERRAISVVGGCDKSGVLHTIADGADHFDLDGMAERTELRGDVVGLPERELGAARTDAKDGYAHSY